MECRQPSWDGARTSGAAVTASDGGGEVAQVQVVRGIGGGGPGTGNPGQVFLPLNVRLAYLLGLGLGNSVLGAAAVAWEWVGPRVQVERGTAGGKEEWPWVARATS